MKKIVMTLLAAFTLSAAGQALQPAAALAACPPGKSPESQVLHGVGQTGSNCTDDGVSNLIRAVVRILSIVVGIAAIIMIIISGFKFITSSGDSNKISSAKSALIYALVGLAIAALAQILVQLVLTQSHRATATTTVKSQKA